MTTWENLNIARRNLILPSLLLILAALSLNLFKIFKNRFKTYLVIFVFFIFIFDILRFAWKFTSFSRENWIFPKTKLLDLIPEDDSSRLLTVDRRILPANFSNYYHLQDVSGYDPLYLLSFNKLVSSWEADAPIIEPSAFNRIVTPTRYESFITDLLGVKYIFSLSQLQSAKLELIAREGETYLYKNNQAFPRVFLVLNSLYVTSELEEMKTLFQLKKQLRQTAVSQEKIDLDNEPLTIAEKATIRIYQPNNIEIETFSNYKRLLVLTDIYHPHWQVYIDGAKSKIYQVDFLFRGVVVESGKHLVEFKAKLL